MEVLPGSDYTAVLAAQSNVARGVVDTVSAGLGDSRANVGNALWRPALGIALPA